MKKIKNFEGQILDEDQMTLARGGGFWDDFLDGNADGVGAGDGPETGRNFAYWVGYAVGKTCKDHGG